MHTRPVVVVHGGAGPARPDRREAQLDSCRVAASAALEPLAAGESALDAAQRAVEVLEADPGLNAGVGSALTREGDIELDASLMEGTGLRAGGVCALPPFPHPIRIARAVLEDGRHVLYAGEGAAELAGRWGFEPVPVDALRTEAALARWREMDRAEAWSGGETVGAVACDARGHVAAATSTGGTMGKRRGRVGDTPIVGAGTYADDAAGAVSATGAGEAILKAGLARDVLERTKRGASAAAAAFASLRGLGRRLDGATAGLIVVTPSGDVGAARTTEAMAFAVARPGGEPELGW